MTGLWAFESWSDAFVNGVAAWNTFGLPALLAALAFGDGGWLPGRESARGLGETLARVARRMGLVHLGLAAWSALRIIDELWAYRVMGILPSNPITGLYGSLLALACDLPLGLGLLRLRHWARDGALALALLRLVIAVWVALWIWRFQAAVDWSEWPRLVLGYLLPLFTMMVLSLPGMKPMFQAGPAGFGRAEIPSPRWARVASRACLLAVVVTASVVVADGLDLAVRAVVDFLALPGPPVS